MTDVVEAFYDALNRVESQEDVDAFDDFARDRKRMADALIILRDDTAIQADSYLSLIVRDALGERQPNGSAQDQATEGRDQ